MISIIELIRYGQFTRRKYLEVLSALPWDEVVKDRGASFGSFRNVFLHSVAAPDRYINYIIPDKLDEYAPLRFEEFQNIESITSFVDQFEAKVNQLLGKLPPSELLRKISIKQRDGTTLEATVENILVHAFLEEMHHRGELIALLWQIDIDPHFMGWLQYLNR